MNNNFKFSPENFQIFKKIHRRQVIPSLRNTKETHIFIHCSCGSLQNCSKHGRHTPKSRFGRPPRLNPRSDAPRVASFQGSELPKNLSSPSPVVQSMPPGSVAPVPSVPAIHYVPKKSTILPRHIS